MTPPAHLPRFSRSRWRLIAWGLAALVLVAFVAANAHLIAVALATQPECVLDALHSEGGAAPFRAAKPSC